MNEMKAGDRQGNMSAPRLKSAVLSHVFGVRDDFFPAFSMR